MINFLNLRYFVLIAQKGNITKIAQSEHVSQQSLSNHIKKIESELGVILLNRKDGCSLTPAGKQFFKYAKRLLEIYEEMKTEMSDISGEAQGMLRIGVTYTRGSIILPKILPDFRREFPQIQVSVNENNPRVLEEYLLGGHLDLIFAIDLRSHPDIEKIDLYGEKKYLIVPKKIAKEITGLDDTYIQKPLDLKDFADYDFLLPTKGNRFREVIDTLAEKENVDIKIVLQTEIIETLFALACNGMGITVYNEMYLGKHKDLLNSKDCPISVVKLNGMPENSHVSIGYNKCRYLSNAAKRFIELAKEKLKS
ncbi:MAG: LysR family transcriptional regulator [Acutalibacteraceae bacterium]|jgi:DNA-binding transcriptional LysR family regulator